MVFRAFILLLCATGVWSVEHCCFPESHSYHIASPAFVGVGGSSLDQILARDQRHMLWKFNVLSNGIPVGSLGWLGTINPTTKETVGGFEWEVIPGVETFCCSQGPGGSGDWIMPPTCTQDGGYVEDGTVALTTSNATVWVRWDQQSSRRWAMLTTEPDQNGECIPYMVMGGDPMMSSATYDMSGYLVTDWQSPAVAALWTMPDECSQAPPCTTSPTVEKKKHFLEFRVRHKKVYSDQKEMEYRRQVFHDNYKSVEQANQRCGHASYAINGFGDIMESEWMVRSQLLPDGEEVQKVDSLGITDLPDSFDWRDKKAINPPRNQQSLVCGSCWAHGSIEAIESALYLAGKGPLTPLSTQQLVDCNRGGYMGMNRGCHGGAAALAFEYAKSEGLMTEEEYPYVFSDGACMINTSMSTAKISDWSSGSFLGNETLMREYLFTKGPLVIGTSVVGWAFYSKGIVTHCGAHPSHVVLLTGWGEENGIPYWNILNSFGKEWGEDGYVRVLRGSNTCGVELGALWPIV